jgi:NADH-quinone oxidoreductase subunit G
MKRTPSDALERIGEVPIYQADALARRAEALQATRAAAAPAAWMNAAVLARLRLRDRDLVWLRGEAGEARLAARLDDRLPDRCVRVPAAHPATIALGPMFGTLEAQPTTVAARMAG